MTAHDQGKELIFSNGLTITADAVGLVMETNSWKTTMNKARVSSSVAMIITSYL